MPVRTVLVRTSLAALLVTGALASATPAAAQNNVAAGAAVGAVTGAIIGGAVTGRAGGAVAGAVVGGATGAAIGASTQPRGRSYYYWSGGRCYYHYPNGQVTRVDRGNCY